MNGSRRVFHVDAPHRLVNTSAAEVECCGRQVDRAVGSVAGQMRVVSYNERGSGKRAQKRPAAALYRTVVDD